MIVRRLLGLTIIASAIVWAGVTIAIAFVAPAEFARIVPFLGCGIAMQIVFLGNLSARSNSQECSPDDK